MMTASMHANKQCTILSPLWCRARENILLLIERTQGEAIQQNPFKMNVKDFLMTLHWLKSYNTEPEMAGGWNYDEQIICIRLELIVDGSKS